MLAMRISASLSVPAIPNNEVAADLPFHAAATVLALAASVPVLVLLIIPLRALLLRAFALLALAASMLVHGLKSSKPAI